jgi:hypothetical protein
MVTNSYGTEQDLLRGSGKNRINPIIDSRALSPVPQSTYIR